MQILELACLVLDRASALYPHCIFDQEGRGTSSISRGIDSCPKSCYIDVFSE